MGSGRVFEAITVDNPPAEDDVEAAYQSWKGGLEDSETPGMVRAFRVPLDEQGKPSYSATGQVRLGTWPIDQYDFDSLCTKIMREYMLPTEQMMAVRLIGTITGKGGLRFNKIVTLQRPNPSNVLPSPTGRPDGISEIMRQMQESNERMMRMFQEMNGSKQGGADGASEMMRTVAMMRVMMEPMMGMMGPILSAVAGRPVSAGSSSSMKEMVETMMLMDKFLGRRGGGGSNDSGPDWLKAVTAVSGVAKPLLEIAAANQQPQRTRQLSAPAATSAPIAPPTQPVNPPVVTTPPTTGAVASGTSVDLTRPSTVIKSPFAPGPNIDAPSSSMTGDAAMFAEMKKQVDAMIEVAQSGADPMVVADQFFELSMLTLANEDDYGKLCAVIENPNFIKVIEIYNPRVPEYAPWLERVRARLVERIQEADTGPGN